MMIYMPFTYISQSHLDWITATLGALSVYAPIPDLVSAQQRDYEKRELLDLRVPQGLDSQQLALAFRQFKQWAHMHDGRIADMAGYLKAAAGHPPLVDESSPTQITHQIRHFGEMDEDEAADPLFQAALFLAMAHEYDQHQDDMARDLNAVDILEKRMLEQMSDGSALEREGLSVAESTGPVGREDEAGLFMPESRIKAWAHLAAADTLAPALLLTTSQSVAGHVSELCADGIHLGTWSVDTAEGATQDANQIREIIASIASMARPDANALATCMVPARSDGNFQLDLMALPGCPPRSLIDRLRANPDAPATPPIHVQESDHTLVGLVRAPGR